MTNSMLTIEFEGSLSELIAHFSNCCESQILSDEEQSEVVKLLRKDIDSLKTENRVIVQKYDKSVKIRRNSGIWSMSELVT